MCGNDAYGHVQTIDEKYDVVKLSCI